MKPKHRKWPEVDSKKSVVNKGLWFSMNMANIFPEKVIAHCTYTVPYTTMTLDTDVVVTVRRLRTMQAKESALQISRAALLPGGSNFL